MGNLSFQKGSKSPSAGKMKSATTEIISVYKVEKNHDFINALISIIIDELEFWLHIFRKVDSCFCQLLYRLHKSKQSLKKRKSKNIETN